ncbi:hypothetical protein PQX77_017769, partial [Marasmius sp. AFHP31]
LFNGIFSSRDDGEAIVQCFERIEDYINDALKAIVRKKLIPDGEHDNPHITLYCILKGLSPCRSLHRKCVDILSNLEKLDAIFSALADAHNAKGYHK